MCGELFTICSDLFVLFVLTCLLCDMREFECVFHALPVCPRCLFSVYGCLRNVFPLHSNQARPV